MQSRTRREKGSRWALGGICLLLLLFALDASFWEPVRRGYSARGTLAYPLMKTRIVSHQTAAFRWRIGCQECHTPRSSPVASLRP